MPLGSRDTDAKARRVIMVVTPKDMIELAAHASAQRDVGALAKAGWLPIAVGSIAGNVGALALRLMRKPEYRGQSSEVLMQIVEEALDLGVPIAFYEPELATELFTFGVAQNPISGRVYVQHPMQPRMYIAPEEFDRTLSRAKEAAFRQLASALGVKELRLATASVQTEGSWLRGKVSLQEAAAQAGVTGAFGKDEKFEKFVYSKYGPPRKPPHVPEELKEWVEIDVDFQTMVKERIEGHLLEHRVKLEFRQGFGAHGEVAAKLIGRGLTAGGGYKALVHSIWQFEAEYWPRS